VIFRFEDCLLDTERRELRRGGILCPLEPQVFDLLEYLLRNRHRFVSRNELQGAVWGGRIVSAAALDTRLTTARAVIGDSGATQRLIHTLRKKGFRFVGEVLEETRPNKPTLGEAGNGNRALLAEQPTIAVLPFTNISGDRRQGALADAITDDLMTVLSRIGWLVVATRASSFAFKDRATETEQIARKLGVRYLLAGSVHRAGDRVRITAELVDAIADYRIWSERYDQDFVDSFAFQDEICDRVLKAVEPQLYLTERLRIERSGPMNLKGWECFVRALSLMNSRDQRNVMAACALLQKAASINTESAQVHSLLSMANTLRVHMGWQDRQNVIPAALAHARKALCLNPDEPWAHAALGYASIWKQPEEAIAPIQHAIAQNPNFAIGHYFLALASAYAGHRDDIFKHANAAECLAHCDLLAHGYAGAHDNVRATASFGIEQYRQGADFARKAAARLPNSPTAYRSLLINLALSGRSAEAKHTLQTLKRVAPNISRAWVERNAVWASEEAGKRYVEAFRIAGLY
jgi:TolB-like protein